MMESLFRELISIAFADSLEERRLVVMLVGYFDDSGTHDTAHAVVIGGFVGEAAHWLGFNDAWCGVLKEFGLDYFHTADWSNKAPPYDQKSGWDDEKRHVCMNRLLGVIAHHELIAVGVGIPMEHYNSLLSQVAKDRLSPYGLA